MRIVRIECSGVDTSLLAMKKASTAVHWGLLLVLSVVIYGSHAPLITLCKTDGLVPFSSLAVVICIELCKLLISVVLLVIMQDFHYLHIVSWQVIIPYALPAILYAVNNNLVVHMQHFMDPSTYQVLSNLKIGCTALLYSVFLRRRLSLQKWVAVFLLMVAGACHTYAGIKDHQKPFLETQMHITPLGILMILLYSFISGLSAVYTELILKTQKLPLNLQNLFLYFFGVFVNSGVHVLSSEHEHFFEGFSIWVVVIILTQALNGLIMSVVMKHSNNITRLFVISCSMLVNAVLSVLLFQLQLTPMFFLAACLIGVAGHLCYQA